jgi:hypothetical protein
MTESEWATGNDPLPLLRCLPAGQASRKRLLLVCAAWQQLRDALPDTPSQQALAALEQLAEGHGNEDPGKVMWTALQIEEPIWPRIWQESGDFQPTWTAETAALAATVLFCTAALGFGDEYFATEAEAARAAEKVAREGATVAAAWTEQLARLAALVRDVFGPLLFRPIALDPAWRTWNGGVAVKLAQAIDDDHAFDRLTVLADVLEEAGCTSADILDHCREGGEHVHGCWAVDLILGKE